MRPQLVRFRDDLTNYGTVNKCLKPGYLSIHIPILTVTLIGRPDEPKVLWKPVYSVVRNNDTSGSLKPLVASAESNH
jgi:hypothetical protein